MRIVRAIMMSKGGLAWLLEQCTPYTSFREHETSTKLKSSLYKSLVLSIVLYAAETWILKKRDQNRLLSFEMSCLRRILGISRREKIRNDCIRKQLGLETSILDRIHTRQLAYYGHITRMDNSRLPLTTIDGSTKVPGPEDDLPSDGQTVAKRAAKPEDWRHWLKPEDSLRIGLVGGPSSVAATLTEHSPGQERLKSSQVKPIKLI